MVRARRKRKKTDKAVSSLFPRLDNDSDGDERTEAEIAAGMDPHEARERGARSDTTRGVFIWTAPVTDLHIRTSTYASCPVQPIVRGDTAVCPSNQHEWLHEVAVRCTRESHARIILYVLATVGNTPIWEYATYQGNSNTGYWTEMAAALSVAFKELPLVHTLDAGKCKYRWTRMRLMVEQFYAGSQSWSGTVFSDDNPGLRLRLCALVDAEDAFTGDIDVCNTSCVHGR